MSSGAQTQASGCRSSTVHHAAQALFNPETKINFQGRRAFLSAKDSKSSFLAVSAGLEMFASPLRLWCDTVMCTTMQGIPPDAAGDPCLRAGKVLFCSLFNA